MADYVLIGDRTGKTLYFQVRDSSGQVWNGTAFESYSSANWGDYDVSLTEQGSSGVYAGAFPADISAGVYAVTAFERTGGSVAEGDPVVGQATAAWDGSGFLDLTGLESHGDSAWATATGFGTLTAETLRTALGMASANLDTQLTTITDDTDEIQQELEDGGRIDLLIDTLLTRLSAARAGYLDTLVSRLTAARAAYLDKLNVSGTLAHSDAASSYQADVSALAAAAATIAKLETALEADGGVYRLTENALEQGPGGDATSAKQDTIIDALAALENVSASEVATAVLGAAVDGTLDVETALKHLYAVWLGKALQGTYDPSTVDYYDHAGTTKLVTLTTKLDASERTRS